MQISGRKILALRQSPVFLKQKKQRRFKRYCFKGYFVTQKDLLIGRMLSLNVNYQEAASLPFSFTKSGTLLNILEKS